MELPSLTLLSESIHLNAGGVAPLTVDELSLQDPDTADSSLHFVITVRGLIVLFLRKLSMSSSLTNAISYTPFHSGTTKARLGGG